MRSAKNIYLGKEPASVVPSTGTSFTPTHSRILTKYHLDIQPQSIVRQLGVGKMQMTEIAKALSEMRES